MNTEQVLAVADRLAEPRALGLPTDRPWWRQSLAHGVPGIALLHAELAAAGLRPWERVHNWLAEASRLPITAGDSTGLFYGAPGVAFALAGVSAVHPGAYRGALRSLDGQITADARRRAEAAHARIAAGRLPLLAEFDTIRGLAGVGAYLLRRDRDGAALRAVLAALVGLTKPLIVDGEVLPGWWAPTGPTGRPDPEDFPGGHANLGLAHGIGGPLALLALAALRDVQVPGQLEAIEAVCAWLDRWRSESEGGSCWPYLLSRGEHDAGRQRSRGDGAKPRRPSWCYGTAGLARAQQLAALATGDADRRRTAENALVHALTDPAQRAATVDDSLCHGYAGLAHIAMRAAADAEESTAPVLRKLAAELLAAEPREPSEAPGLLEGLAGVALASLTPATGVPPPTGWDTCLLIA